MATLGQVGQGQLVAESSYLVGAQQLVGCLRCHLLSVYIII